MTDSCGNCRWYEKGAAVGQGSCHRYPPVAYPVGQDSFQRPLLLNVVPTVNADFACGEYKARVALVMERGDLQ